MLRVISYFQSLEYYESLGLTHTMWYVFQGEIFLKMSFIMKILFLDVCRSIDTFDNMPKHCTVIVKCLIFAKCNSHGIVMIAEGN